MEYNQTLLPLAIILLLISTWFTLHHAKRRTSLFILLLSIISFGLGSAAVALLPIDLSYASSMNTLSDSNNDNNNNDDDNHSHNNEGEVNDSDNRDITDYTNETEEDSIDNHYLSNNNPTYLPWQITYWTTFFLAWLVLPIARESLLSGYFTLRQRLKDGFRRSFRTISIMACLGILSTIGMAIHLKSVHFVSVVIPVLMALSNTYGLLLVSLLLGNGLVNIPKRLWRQACPANELRRTRIMAPIFEEELFEAVMGLEDVEDKVEEVCRTAVSLRESEEEDRMLENEEGDVVNLGNGVSRLSCWIRCCCRKRGGGEYCKVDEVTEFHECLEELVRRKNETADLCSERRTRRGVAPRRQNSASSSSSNDENSNGGNGGGNEINTMDITYLVSLSRQLKRAQERVTSAQLRWNHLMEHSRLFSALIDDRSNLDGSIRNDDEEEAGHNNNSNNNDTDANLLTPSTTPTSPRVCYRKLRYTLQRFWIRCLRYPTYRAVSIITATLSAFVLLSEVALSATKINLSPFSWTLHALDAYRSKNDTTIQLVFQIFALIPLVYMSLCVYTCLFQMSLLGPYCLRGNRQSAGVALVFNMQYLVRLQFPLGYNYLLMLKYDMTHCAFSNIMSDMSTIPFFGTSFSVYAPLLILAVCLFTLCDFYPKILRLLGIEHEDALLLGDEDELDGKANEGIQLMKRDTERRNSGSATAVASSSPEKQSLNGRRNLIV